MRVLLLHNIINPHMTPAFEALGSMAGIELRVAYFAASEGDRTWASETQEGFQADLLPGRVVNLFLAWDTFSFHFNPGLTRYLRRLPWDVLINTGWSSWSHWVAFRECRRQRKPHVLWSGSTEHEVSWRRRLTAPLVRHMVRQSDGWASYGSASARYLQQMGARGPVRLAFHCTDNARFLRRYHEALPGRDERLRSLGLAGKRVVLFVGRLVQRKGAEELLQAFLRLANQHPDAALLIVGDGPMRSRLEAARSQAPGRIVLAGAAKFDDLAAWYQLGDVFVVPSHEEVWGLVINEACLAGLPVIATSCCGAAEDLVEEAVNGHLVPPGDIDALTRALDNLLADPERARNMGEQSRRLVAKCSPENLALALAEACTDALRRRSRGRADP